MENQDKTVKPDLLKQSLENPSINTNKPSFSTGGPQFGIKKTSKFKEWISKYGSSVILPIIALLILAGGIYLYANQKGDNMTSLLEENTANIQGNITEQGQSGIIAQEEIKPDDQKIPEAIKQDGNIIETAIRGDGVTHLSRRVLKNYLEDNPQELTNEHKIYIEDYLKDNIGSRPLEIGEEISFSENLIQQAINASLELTPEQLKNLEKYSALVAW